jgi:hypothetical protein
MIERTTSKNEIQNVSTRRDRGYTYDEHQALHENRFAITTHVHACTNGVVLNAVVRAATHVGTFPEIRISVRYTAIFSFILK